MAISIGNEAKDRASNESAGYTVIENSGAANETGTITSVELWFVNNAANVEVAIFYVVSGNNLSTRSNATIGNVTGGSKQTFAVNLSVVAGDFIGVYTGTGLLEADGTGGFWYKIGDNIPADNVAFGLVSGGNSHSIYGTGNGGVVTQAIKVGKESRKCRYILKQGLAISV